MRERARPGFHRLSKRFFARRTLRAARDLIGKVLVHEHRGGTTAGIIVETEGYTGRGDPGSHAHRGPRTRNLPMFGPAGRAYVYRCHLYPLLNVVTEPDGVPGAVLLRAVEPVAGLPLMRRRSGDRPVTDLARGPGRLARAFGVTLEHNRADLLRGRLYLARGARRPLRVARATRVGLRGPAARLPWRFYAAGNPFVSHV